MRQRVFASWALLSLWSLQSLLRRRTNPVRARQLAKRPRKSSAQTVRMASKHGLRTVRTTRHHMDRTRLSLHPTGCRATQTHRQSHRLPLVSLVHSRELQDIHLLRTTTALHLGQVVVLLGRTTRVTTGHPFLIRAMTSPMISIGACPFKDRPWHDNLPRHPNLFRHISHHMPHSLAQISNTSVVGLNSSGNLHCNRAIPPLDLHRPWAMDKVLSMAAARNHRQVRDWMGSHTSMDSYQVKRFLVGLQTSWSILFRVATKESTLILKAKPLYPISQA